MPIGLNEFTKRNEKQQRLGKRHDATCPEMQLLSPVRILLSRPCNNRKTSPRTWVMRTWISSMKRQALRRKQMQSHQRNGDGWANYAESILESWRCRRSKSEKIS